MTTLKDLFKNKTEGKDLDIDNSLSDDAIVRDVQDSESKIKSEKITFPINAFPPRIRSCCQTLADCDGFPIEYYLSNVISATSALMGIAFRIKVDVGQEHTPITFMVLVGDSSAGKGRTMDAIFRIVRNIEKKHAENYKVAIQSWNNECFNVRMTDAKADLPIKPRQRELVMDDFTFEKIIEVMKYNPKGLIITAEEILSWLNNMNAYKAGSEEQFWIKDWDSAAHKYSRKQGSTIYIPKTNCSVVGGIQPHVLHEMLANGRQMTGFSARLLFSYPNDFTKKYYNSTRPHFSVYETIERIFTAINELPNRIEIPTDEHDIPYVEQTVIGCTDQAKQVFIDYFNKLTDANNETDDDREKGIFGKMVSYTARFALIIEMLKFGEYVAKKYNYESNNWTGLEQTTMMPADWEKVEKEIIVTKESMESAVQLSEYYITTAKKVLRKLETPVDMLKSNLQSFYRAIPMQGMKHSDIVRIGQKLKISESSIKRFLNKPELFKKQGDMYLRRYA